MGNGCVADLIRRSIAAELGADDPALDRPGLRIRVLDPARLCLVTGGPTLAPNTAATGDPCWIWLAPGRCLAVCTTAAAEIPGGFVTDVTDGSAVLELTGEHLPDLLAMGCTLDRATLGAGRSAQTLFAGVRVVLWADGAGLRLCVDRSFAAFLLTWMQRAASALTMDAH